jgi:hypothetical protein
METTRVDICYRPLRIAWAVHSGDRESFRKAVRLTHTLWGGRFNPIVLVDRAKEAKQVIELFRADVIMPVGESEEVVAFQGAKMSIRFGQGLSSDHVRPSRRRAFAITTSFLMIAVRATFPDFPARMS